MPQYLPFAFVQTVGVQAPESSDAPHTLGDAVAAAGLCAGASAAVHLTAAAVPHDTAILSPLAWTQLVGVHAPESGDEPHTLARPAPPQLCPPPHPPQSIKRRSRPPRFRSSGLPFAWAQLSRVQAPESGA
jgi:hypothetical protein